MEIKPIFDAIDGQDNLENLPVSKLDYTQAQSFLHSYRGSEATYNAYRRELERLLHWCGGVVKKPLKELKRSDIEDFITFCQSPPLDWVGTKHVARSNPEWRPFVVQVSKKAFRDGHAPNAKHYELSQAGVKAVFAVLSSFYNFLIQEEYTDHNPVAQIRQKSRFIRSRQGQAPVRRLSETQWVYVIETAEDLTNVKPEVYERTLFIMNALYSMYLRISELSESERWQPQMGDFQMDGDGNWWFTTVGKGNKERQISVSDGMLAALRRYRKFLGLSALPSPGEHTPMVPAIRGKGGIKSTRQIREIVQHCFDQAMDRLRSDGLSDEADQMMSATVHWLRHTGISDDVKFRPREHVRDDAGHGSSAITDRYIDVEMRERHASGKNKKIKPDE